MDGFGWTPNETYGNAVAAAKKPFIDSLMAKYPMTTIEASGMAVGLPDGQMGNSEVGHTNMGAGRIVCQQLCQQSGRQGRLRRHGQQGAGRFEAETDVLQWFPHRRQPGCRQHDVA